MLKQTGKRILSLVLCAVMVVLMYPAPASAVNVSDGTNTIHSVSMDVGSTIASVQVTTKGNSILIVALYNLGGAMLGIGTTDILTPVAQQSVSVAVSCAMKDSTRIKAFLLDKNSYSPLCENYDSDNDYGESYAITALSVDGSEMTATVSTGNACILYAEILSEDSKNILHTESAATTEHMMEEKISVTVSDSFTFPSYYVVRAVLRDEQGNDLSTPYTTLQYTSAYQKFESRTPEDFPNDVVLDFGDGGFGVLAEDTTVIDSIATVSGDNKYTFSAQETPHAGDVLLLTDDNFVQTPVKVKSVTDNRDGTVTILQDDEATLSDLYQVLNLDTFIDVGAASQRDGDARLMAADLNQGGVDLIKVSGSITADHLTVSASASVGLKVKSVYDKKLFGEDYFEWESYTEVNATANTTVSGSVGSSDLKDAFGNPTPPEIVLYKGPITLVRTGLAALHLEATIPLEFSIKGTGTAEVGFVSKSGFRYNPTDGLQPIKSHDVPTSKFEITGGFEIKTGPKITLKAVIAHGILEGSISGQTGLKATGTAKADLKNTSSTKYHACDVCSDITISAFFSCKGDITYNITKKLNGSLLSVDLLSGSWTLGKWYYSFKNDSDSYFKGRPHGGKGECPNYKYQITVNTVDKYGSPVTGLPVTIQSDHKNIDSGASPYKIHLYNGEYIAAADFDSGTFKRDFKVSGRIVTVTVNEQETLLHGTITNALNKKAIENAHVSAVLEDGKTFRAVSNQQGGYTLTLPNGTYELHVSADLYQDWTGKVLVNPGVNTLNIQMQPAYYTVTVTVVDEKGNDLSGITINGTGLNPAPVTGAGGTAAFRLLAGTYQLTVTDGTSTSSETLTVTNGPVDMKIVLKNVPDDVVYFNGHAYKVFEQPMKWEEAKVFCESFGGHLATITSQAENDFITTLLPDDY